MLARAWPKLLAPWNEQRGLQNPRQLALVEHCLRAYHPLPNKACLDKIPACPKGLGRNLRVLGVLRVRGAVRRRRATEHQSGCCGLRVRIVRVRARDVTAL
jgi:hypothetical protein